VRVADVLVTRFEDIFVSAGFMPQRGRDRVFLGGEPACTTAEIMRAVGRDALIDDVADRLYRDRLVRNPEANMELKGIVARPQPGSHDLELLYRSRAIGRLRATSATAVGGKPIEGNFLAPGSHWGTGHSPSHPQTGVTSTRRT
jgi:hypothetical protein